MQIVLIIPVRGVGSTNGSRDALVSHNGRKGRSLVYVGSKEVMAR
jgi:hypothetical protein